MDIIEAACDEYEDATLVHSLPQRHCPSYKKLLFLGRPVIPSVLRRFQQGKYNPHWFLVLEEITGEHPLPPPPATTLEGAAIPRWVAIDVKATASAWLQWGKAHGYIP